MGACGTLRASTLVCLNFLFILHEKTYFFYFTHPLLQNTYISLSILHFYSIKYSLFYNFLLFTPSPPLSLSQTHSYHHHPATITTIITPQPNHHSPNRQQDHQNPPMNHKSQADQDQNPPTCDGRWPQPKCLAAPPPEKPS